MSALLGGADQHLVGLTQQDGLLAGAQFAGVLVAALEDKAGAGSPMDWAASLEPCQMGSLPGLR